MTTPDAPDSRRIVKRGDVVRTTGEGFIAKAFLEISYSWAEIVENDSDAALKTVQKILDAGLVEIVP